MNRLSDELIMTYLVGDLSPAEQKLITDAARLDSELREQITAIRKTRDAFGPRAEPAKKDSSDELQVLFIRGRSSSDAADGKPLSQNRPRAKRIARSLRRYLRPSRLSWSYAAAIMAALFVGFGGHTLLNQIDSGREFSSNEPISVRDGEVFAVNGLRQALELTPNGKRSAGSSAVNYIVPLLTFKDKQKRFCREYDMAVANGKHFSGVACRSQDGHWQIQLHVATKSSAASSETFSPASNGAVEIVELMSEQMKVGKALNKSEVETSLKTGWQMQ
ncbi:hypothetical protein MnTg02_02747 [bacterium MnTg02]|nr:hypothetical protein MnTg02_02747 [bacterium MnTg02]